MTPSLSPSTPHPAPRTTRRCRPSQPGNWPAALLLTSARFAPSLLSTPQPVRIVRTDEAAVAFCVANCQEVRWKSKESAATTAPASAPAPAQARAAAKGGVAGTEPATAAGDPLGELEA